MIDVASPARIAWVDYAKGWCIVLVVMMHSTLGVGEALGGEGVLHWFVAWARPFRMPDFFLISGLFLSQVIALPWRSYLDRKVLHFLYFFIVWTLIQLVVKKGPLLICTPPAFLQELGFALVEPYGTLWFIYLLPVFFVTVRLLAPLPRPALLILAAAMEIFVHASGWTSGFTMVDESLARFVYFCAGYVLAPAVFALARWAGGHRHGAILLLLVWAVAEALLAFLPANLLPDALVPDQLIAAPIAALPLVSLAAGAAGACAVVTLSSLLAATGRLKALRALGEHSLVIYLAFFLPMALTRTVLVGLGLEAVGLVSALVTIVAIVVPLLVHRIVRDTPLGLLFHRPHWARLYQRRTRLIDQPAA